MQIDPVGELDVSAELIIKVDHVLDLSYLKKFNYRLW